MKKCLVVCLFLVQLGLCGFTTTWEQYKAETLPHLRLIEGWCTPEKADKMMDLIYETHPQICVEIGVFGGSSIFPTAKALKYLGKGVVFAIDPWQNEECVKGYSPSNPNFRWWYEAPLPDIYQHFLNNLQRYDLFAYCPILRMTSAWAVQLFSDESIDILHIDGNHTEEAALEDATLYLPKVKKGGYIWFDDIDWESTKKAGQYLKEHCRLDQTRSTKSYALFQKN
jgi:predicted O-methyltransferase YrrM